MVTAVSPDVDRLIDEGPVGRYQIFVVALCGALMFLDGLDFNMMSFLVPSLTKEWGISSHELSFIFSIGLMSAALTSLINGPIADRWGRRNLMIGYAGVFGIFTCLAAFARNPEEFAVLRFLAGIGLGGALPNAIALGVEYIPARHRSFTAVILVSLYGLGQSAGGALTAMLLENHGWRFVLGLGGGLVLIVFLTMLVALPESVRFLAQQPEHRAKVARLLRRINPAWQDDGASLAPQRPEGRARSSIRAIFAEGRAPVTLTLLVVVGLNNAQITFLLFWLPNVIIASGMPIGTAVTTITTVVISGIIGSLVLGRFADRVGHHVILLGTNILAILALLLFGNAIGHIPVMLAAAAAIGIGINGFQAVANSYAASFYPTAIRATGAGTVFATGRLVGILGPIVGSIFLSMNLSQPAFFALDAALVSLCSLCLLLTWRHRTRGTARPAAAAA